MGSAGRSDLDPRRSVRTRVGLAFGASALLLALLLSLVVGRISRDRLEEQTGARLAELAHQTVDKLDRQMFERYKDIEVLAILPVLRSPAVPTSERRMALERLQASYPAYAWIGLTDLAGAVVVATGGVLEGVDVSQDDWFSHGQRGTWVGDVHEATLLARLLPTPPDGQLRLLDVAAPVYDSEGGLNGVLGAHPSWAWAREVQDSLLESVERDRGVEMLIVAADGKILLQSDGAMGPFAAPAVSSVALAQAGASGFVGERWPDGVEYVTGYAASRGYRSFAGLGWIVLIRQSSAVALAPARELQAVIVGWGLVFGVVFSLIGAVIADRIAVPLRRLALVAERIQHGERDVLVPTVRGKDELATLTHGFRDMVASLTEQERQLRDLNRTLERRVRERTREAQMLALVARHTDNAVMIADGRQRIEWVNEGFTQLTGYTLHESLGRLPDELLHPRDGDGGPPTARPVALGGDGGTTIEEQWRTKSGERPWVAVEYQPIHGEDGTTTNAVFIARDVSARRQVEQRLRHVALHDTLTGLPNRALLLDRLDHVIRRSRREHEARFALLFVDLDGFKAVNDRRGHAVGDLLLIAVARRLEGCLRPGDTVARIGGDELAILIELPNPAEEAQHVAQRVLEHVCRPFDLEGHPVAIGASIGVAIGDDPAATPDAILRAADAAMYVGKRSGKGRWIVYEGSMAAEPTRQETRARGNLPAAAPEARSA